ncbi:MAG TPA: hypothetical protein VL326_09710 [Kofleriaceae bacterium]|nr:hypothetical protein [Kofleriaceae bacterium]
MDKLARFACVILAAACNSSSTPHNSGMGPDAGTAPPDAPAGEDDAASAHDAGSVALSRTAIVFAAALDGQSQPDLYAVDGASITRLTTTAGAELYPAISPDRTEIAFVRDAHLYVLDVVVGVERKIAEQVGRRREISGAAWSPDGTRMVYPYPREAYPVGEDGLDESYDTTLHFVNADGTNDIAYNEPAESGQPPGIGTLGEPAWSSTNLIAFTVADDCPDCAGGAHYAYSHPDGSDFQVIEPTDLGSNPLYPRHDLDWSPDATQWAFTSQSYLDNGPTGPNPRVATRSVANTEIRALTTIGASHPRYAPDGQSIAFLRADGIYVMSATGGGEHRIVSASGVSSLDW